MSDAIRSDQTNPKPPVVWLEGVLDYFNISFPHGPDDPRRIGFGVARQMVGLYLLEMLMKYGLDHVNTPYNRNHNLLGLFNKLPEASRHAVESKYTQILSNRVSEAWDFASSVSSFLEYLGDDPMNESRYFWAGRKRPHNMSIMFLQELLQPLLYAFFIGLHSYPEGNPLEERYDTKFISLEGSLNEQEEREREDPPEKNMERDGKQIPVGKFWLEGLLTSFTVPFPHKSGDPRSLGFQISQRIVGLYLVEMLLKYALDDLGTEFGHHHKLYELFQLLPRARRRSVGRMYHKILGNQVPSTWDYAMTAESLLQHLGRNPITECRYFWEQQAEVIHLSPGPLMPLIYALFIELHSYPYAGLMSKRYDTIFLRFEEYELYSTKFLRSERSMKEHC